MSQANLRFAPDILKRLGEELNPGVDHGLLELIKNAYDADATKCEVELINVQQPGGVIRISDDGVGMTEKQLRQSWLIIGRSTKGTGKKTPRGRVQAGSKGLGRLAALRLGLRATCVSRPKHSPRLQHRLEIDWGDFDEAEAVEDVSLKITTEPRPIGMGQGTDITLEALSSPLGQPSLASLARSMIMLADPFGDDPSGFTPVLKTTEYKELGALVKHRYFGEADFSLHAEVDDAGFAEARVTDRRGKTVYVGTHQDVRARGKGPRRETPYRCPRAEFRFWVFLLKPGAFHSQTVQGRDVRAWLQAFGGVHVYIDGIRVSPYGDPGDDWLQLNVSRARSPEERPSTNNSIGKLTVREAADTLQQKTDRTGFVESEAFADLREFAVDALEWMARRRMSLAQNRRRTAVAKGDKAVASASQTLRATLTKVPSKVRADVTAALTRYERAREGEATRLREEVLLYRTMSTVGITAATSAHDATGNALKVLDLSLKTLERRLKRHLVIGSDIEDPLSTIHRNVDALRTLAGLTMSLLNRDKRRIGATDVNDSVVRLVADFAPLLRGRDTVSSLDLDDGSMNVWASEAAIEAILANLLTNALNALTAVGRDRHVSIRTRRFEGRVVLNVLDSGPGITGIPIADVWLPGETTTPGGTGLGLTIVRDTAADMGAQVSAEAHGDLGGATFSVSIPLIEGART